MHDPAVMLEVILFNLRHLRPDVAECPETLAGVDAALAHLQASRLSWAKWGAADDPTPLEIET